MNRFLRSWELFKSSLAVMMHNKMLVAFPILVTVITGFMVILFLMPVAFQRTGYSYASSEHWEAVGKGFFNGQNPANENAAPNASQNLSRGRNANPLTAIKPLWIGYFAVLYFASMFMATFFNVAFYREILNALSGQPVSILAGLRFAATKWKIILMWTLFAGVVGLCIKAIERRLGFIGQWIAKLLGAVWSVACVFVIPVIVVEQDTANPIVVLKKSAQMLTKTWGESLIGYVGVNLGSWIILLFSLLWLGCGIAMAVVSQSIWLGAAVVLGWLVAVFVLSYLTSVASQIFRCALFLYASQGTMPHPYNAEMAALAWKTKKK